MSEIYTLNLNIHGADAQLISDSPLLIKKLKDELGLFVVDNINSNHDSVKIYFKIIRSFTKHKLWYRFTKKERFINATEQIFSYTDLDQLTTFFCANKNWCIEEAVILVISSLGYLTKLKLCKNNILTVFHAASFSLDKRGILLLGNSGAGKTSLSFLCCRHGFTYLSDEDSFVIENKKQNNFLILGFQRNLRLANHVIKLFKIDFRRVSLKPPTGWTMKRLSDGSLEDEWGLRFKSMGLYNEFIWNNPLKDIQDVSEIENHTWPNTEAIGRTAGLEKEAKKLESEGWALSTGTSGIIVGGLFEIACWLRGLDKFMLDLYNQPKIACAILDRILKVYLELFDQYLDAIGDYVLMVMFTDDVGAQTQMIIPPRFYRQYLKPRHKKLFDLIHSKTDAKVFLHTCGSVDPVINDFIEVGVDILNPVQPRSYAMESTELKRKYGDRICFHGGFDIQQVLPFGKQKEIEDEAKRRIGAFGPGGGYIFGAAHNIQPDVPPQNVVSMYKAAEKFGKYPIKI